MCPIFSYWDTTEFDFIVRLVQTEIGRSTLVVAVIGHDACPFVKPTKHLSGKVAIYFERIALVT